MLEVSVGTNGVFACPACQQEITVTAPPAIAANAAAPSGDQALCAICQTPIAAGDSRAACPACNAGYHEECWNENGGCAIYGCDRVPPTEGRAAIEIPVAYWGQEHKPCPVCNAEILAAALRCRHCGSVFQTARPLDSVEFSRAASHEAQAPRLRRNLIILFVLCLIPLTAPIGALIALFFTQFRREEIGKLPSLYGALAKIGMGVGFLQTAAIVVLAVIFTLTRTF
jgi:hypothetical protein